MGSTSKYAKLVDRRAVFAIFLGYSLGRLPDDGVVGVTLHVIVVLFLLVLLLR